MDGYKEEVVVEDVHILGPVAHRGVAAVQQFRVEVRVHRVHLGTNRKYNNDTRNSYMLRYLMPQ